MRRFLIAVASLVLSASWAAAQDRAPSGVVAAPDSPASASAETDRVVVTGERPQGQSLRDYISNFVAEIGKPVSSNFGYARWDGRICVGVENVELDAAQYIADRISEVALDLGLRPGAPGCAPNIAIIFTVDGAALAGHLVETEPTVFRPFGGTGGTTQGLHALEAFTTSEAPVRWWQVTMVVDWAGNVAIELPEHARYPPCFGEIRVCVDGAGSRITNAVRDELRATFVIVDASKLEAVTWTQLADYLAMVSLAQIDPQAEPTSYETILNLFHPPASAPSMTDWDRTYLRTLYEFDPHRMPDQQRGALTNEMVRQHTAGDE
jgi:hypothetical protein